jgi:hypothetical protein
MAIWDEHKHKRFHGKFTSMGMNVKTLRDKHKVHIKPGSGANAVYHGRFEGQPGGTAANNLGVVHRHPSGGFKAFVNKDKGVQAVSEHPFRSRAEAAAAIAAVHPAVKTLHAPGDSPAERADLAERQAKAKRRKVPKGLSPNHPSLQPGYGRGLRRKPS